MILKIHIVVNNDGNNLVRQEKGCYVDFKISGPVDVSVVLLARNK
jgi:hypothetical protein